MSTSGASSVLARPSNAPGAFPWSEGLPKRLLVVLAILAVMLAGQAASTPSMAPAQAIEVQSHLWGNAYTVSLNRSETNSVMFGAGAATAVSSVVPAMPGKALQAAFGVYTAYANWAYNRGMCLKFYVYRVPRTAATPFGWAVTGWHYNGGHCR